MVIQLVTRAMLAWALLLVALAGIVSAQIDPQVRDRVAPAVVQIALLVEVTEGGITNSQYLPVGSGTIVSPDGLILTNHHVVDMQAHQVQLDLWKAQAAAEAAPLVFSLNTESVLVLSTERERIPERSTLRSSWRVIRR